MTMSDMRERQLNIRLSEEEAQRFERVADHYGLNIAATIRMLFKEKARALGFEPGYSGIADALLAHRKYYEDRGEPVPPYPAYEAPKKPPTIAEVMGLPKAKSKKK